MRTPLPLKIAQEEQGKVYIPTSIQLKTPIKHILFGTSSCDCEVIQVDKQEIKLSEDIFVALKIPYSSTTQVFIHDDHLYIGPLVGIFTAGFSESMIRPIGERTLFFAKLLAQEKAVGAYVFIFGAKHIDWEKGTIHGLFHNHNGWETVEVPFPNVVYDRLPNRRTEKHKALREIKQRMQHEYLIPWFNPGFFDKWEIHQLLEGDYRVSTYLPETHKSPTFTLIERMLSKYQHVYIKPAKGSLGLGIYQVLIDRETGNYYCRYRDQDGKNRLQRFSSVESFINTHFRHKQLEHYIVQQGIHLLRSDHKTIDFRIHTNKDEKGNWQVSVMAGKIAGRGSVTTHLNNGGVVRTLTEIFPDVEECKKVTDSLKQAALSLSEAIDSRQKGHIGELGFDLGVDKNGSVWLFEANSKPGRSIFSHPKLRKYDKLSSRLPLQYAVYLTETTIKKPEEVYK
ncbi:YheC/YheD family protein [Bacillus sp. HNG]|uniref:YheC/YheD family endospore coat-associated protein n=1 Tax=Bacillus sp. HNG TaxID=2293325 RepID=UPI000E2E7F17|nr:YheC/YheD family protein [Bacillus sp. HNG]RFB18430.1 YheC/YheD family protein [Bacillus sp. HNG]